MKLAILSSLVLSLNVFGGVIESIDGIILDNAKVAQHASAASGQTRRITSILRQGRYAPRIVSPDTEIFQRATEYSDAIVLKNHIGQVQEHIEGQLFRNNLAEVLHKDGSALDKELNAFKAKVALESSRVSRQVNIALINSCTSTLKRMNLLKKWLEGQAFKDVMVRLEGEQVADNYIESLKTELNSLMNEVSAKIGAARAEAPAVDEKVFDDEEEDLVAMATSDLGELSVGFGLRGISDQIALASDVSGQRKSFATIRSSLDDYWTGNALSRDKEASMIDSHVAKIQERIASGEFRANIAQALHKDENAIDDEIELIKARAFVIASKASFQARFTSAKYLAFMRGMMDSTNIKFHSQDYKELVVQILGSKAGNDYIKNAQKELASLLNFNIARNVAAGADLQTAGVKVKHAETAEKLLISSKPNVRLDDRFIALRIRQISDEIFSEIDPQESTMNTRAALEKVMNRLLPASGDAPVVVNHQKPKVLPKSAKHVRFSSLSLFPQISKNNI